MLRKLRLLGLPVMAWFLGSGCGFTASGRRGSGVQPWYLVFLFLMRF